MFSQHSVEQKGFDFEGLLTQLEKNALQQLDLNNILFNNAKQKLMAGERNTIDVLLEEMIKKLASAVTSATSLESLCLSGNNLKHKNIEVLVKALVSHQKLKSLDLSHNGITADGAKSLAEILKSIKTFEKLDIANNHIGLEGAQAILQIPTLTALDISHNDIKLYNNRKSQPIETAALSHLNVSNNAVTAPMINSVISSSPFLQTLNINNNKVTQQGTKRSEATGKTIWSIMTPSLASLEANHSKVGDEGVKELVASMQKSSSLRKLSLAHNEITVLGIKSLVNLLSSLPLEELDISGNKIENEGLEILVETLINKSEFKVFNISACGITALKDEVNFSEFKALEILDISSNLIASNDVKKFFQSLNQYPALHTLGIRNMGLEHKQFIGLVEQLTHNKLLRALYAEGNQINQKSIEAIANVLDLNRTLTMLTLSDFDMNRIVSNNAKDDLRNQLFKSIQRNQFIQKRLEHNWIPIFILICFIRANAQNTFKYSVLDLIRCVTMFMGEEFNVRRSRSSSESSSQPPSTASSTTSQVSSAVSSSVELKNSLSLGKKT